MTPCHIVFFPGLSVQLGIKSAFPVEQRCKANNIQSKLLKDVQACKEAEKAKSADAACAQTPSENHKMYLFHS
jgi:hypothetical protein